MPSPEADLRRLALAEVLACVHVHLAGEAAEAARRRPADTGGELTPFVVRRHDHQPPLLLTLVDEVVDTVARPARPVLGAEVVEDDEVVATRVGRRLAVAVALTQRVQPAGDVEEERGRPRLTVAPDDLAQDRHRQVGLARAGVAAEEEALAQVGSRPILLCPLSADGERVAGVRHELEVLERAAVIRGGNPHPRPAFVGAALLVAALLGRAAELAVALCRECLAEEDDLLGLELTPAAETASRERATAAEGWRTWHSG